VTSPEGGNSSATATGLIGGVLGAVAGVSLMAVRELGRQQKQQDAGNASREG
jgi:hydrogenase small subunit